MVAVLFLNTPNQICNCPKRLKDYACAAAVAEEGEEGELPVDTASAQGKAAALEEEATALQRPQSSGSSCERAWRLSCLRFR